MLSSFKSIGMPLKGYELYSLFINSNFKDLIYYRKVIYGPSHSLSRIEDYYNVKPSMDGNNILDINEIRNLLYKNITDSAWLNSFTITAPHTHWPDKNPIIYSYDATQNIYIIGPHEIIKDKEYIPVSFVFHSHFPLPYEWVDSSIGINKNEWTICYNTICKLNKSIKKNIPLGIAIDFRFKTSLLNQTQLSLEIPFEENSNNEYKDFSYITNIFDIAKDSTDESMEQVSWHPISDLLYQFSEDEEHILNMLRLNLKSIENPIEQESLLRDIEEQINNINQFYKRL